MDTAVVGGWLAESVVTNAGRHQSPSQTEAEAAARTLMKWAGDDAATRREFFTMIGNLRSGSNGS